MKYRNSLVHAFFGSEYLIYYRFELENAILDQNDEKNTFYIQK